MDNSRVIKTLVACVNLVSIEESILANIAIDLAYWLIRKDDEGIEHTKTTLLAIKRFIADKDFCDNTITSEEEKTKDLEVLMEINILIYKLNNEFK